MDLLIAYPLIVQKSFLPAALKYAALVDTAEHTFPIIRQSFIDTFSMPKSSQMFNVLEYDNSSLSRSLKQLIILNKILL